MKNILLGIVALLCTLKSVAQTDSLKQSKILSAMAEIDKMYTNSCSNNNILGAAYGLMVDGNFLHANYFGKSNLALNQKVDSHTVFRIASMTKSFTAVAILQLRDAGKISLDKPAFIYYPILKKIKYPTADAAEITVRDLLTHSAGLPEDNPWGDRQLAKNDSDLLQLLQSQINFSTNPQTTYEYSNLGFAILGKIITLVSGKPYQQYIKQNIWLPLGMKNTYWEFAEVPTKHLALGYKYYNNKWVEEPMLHDAVDGSWGAMGAMLTTINDFCKYMAFHQKAYLTTKSSSVLKNSSVREMHQPWRLRAFNTSAQKTNGKACAFVQGYGYGLVYQKDCNAVEWIGHAGGLPGFGSQWRFLPKYGIAIVALGNRTYAPFTAINNMVTDSLLVLTNLRSKSLEVSSILVQKQKELVNYLPNIANQSLPNIFAENFFLDNVKEDFFRLTQQKFNTIGKILKILPVVPENNLRGKFTIVGERGELDIYFTLTPEKTPLIQQLNFL